MDEVAQSLSQRWGFTPTEELPGGHCSRVYADAARVLKVPFHGEELTSGYRVAIRVQGTLGPRVRAGDPATGSLLMDRCRPGFTLASAGLEDPDAQAIVIGLIRDFATVRLDGLVPVDDYFSGSDHPLFRQLKRTTRKRTFLHGDLHHYNVLRDGERWLPIDPKGLVGDPAF